MLTLEMLFQSADYIKKLIPKSVDIAIILGSGLGGFAERLEDKIVIPYKDIPHFPISTVDYQEGNLVFGTQKGKAILAMQGRFHYYEGYAMDEVTIPIKVMKLLGISKLIITNASGGIHLGYQPGELVLITDHIKLCAENPLRGINIEELGVRFPDMTNAYNKELIDLAMNVGEDIGIPLKLGVYAYMSGPCYETPAEIKMLRVMGADLVGMSTVPEVIAANHMGIRVLGISCVSNMAAGILDKPLTSEDVLETAELVADKFRKLVANIIERI